MRLSDAGFRQRQARLPPWLTEDAAPRSLEPIVRRLSERSHMHDCNSLNTVVAVGLYRDPYRN
jgi:hypothetical protein